MLKVVLSLRLVMLVVAFGAVLGAALMVWLGFFKLLHSAHAAFVLETPNAKAVIVGVMGATDAFLFGVVLIIFAVAIAFGFVFELPEQLATRLPAWMRVNGIGELKRTLAEVILIYLIVDFDRGLCNRHRRERGPSVLDDPRDAAVHPPDRRVVTADGGLAPETEAGRSRLGPTATGVTERPLSQIGHDNRS